MGAPLPRRPRGPGGRLLSVPAFESPALEIPAIEIPALEIAVGSVVGARIALQGGADRVELCSALEVGGLTPSVGLIEAVVETGVPVHVLVRCRAGDFVYSADEVDVMRRDVRRAVSAGAAGVVVGALRDDGTVDEAVTASLVEVARTTARDEGLREVQVTFHRAIDHSADPVVAVGTLAGLGLDRVLTSGGRADVARALSDGVLARMIHAAGPVEVMAGGGATVADAPALVHAGVAAVHFSARRPSTTPHPEVGATGPDRVPLGLSGGDGDTRPTDLRLVQEMARALKQR